MKPQFFCLQHSLFTSGSLLARASSSDLLMRPDIDIIAEDSELTASAWLVSSTAHSRGVLEDRKLLVPALVIMSSGFLRRSGLIMIFHVLRCAYFVMVMQIKLIVVVVASRKGGYLDL